jgi:hypothetical protein
MAPLNWGADSIILKLTLIVLKKIISITLMMLFTIKKGTAAQKVAAVVLMTTPLAAMLQFSYDHVFPTEYFALVWLVCIISDTAIGMVRHFAQKSFSHKMLFYGILGKIGLSLFIMLLVKVILGMEDFVDMPTVIDWGNKFLKLAVIVYLCGSTVSNTYILSGGKFPPKVFMERWGKFEKNMNPKELIK